RSRPSRRRAGADPLQVRCRSGARGVLPANPSPARARVLLARTLVVTVGARHHTWVGREVLIGAVVVFVHQARSLRSLVVTRFEPARCGDRPPKPACTALTRSTEKGFSPAGARPRGRLPRPGAPARS